MELYRNKKIVGNFWTTQIKPEIIFRNVRITMVATTSAMAFALVALGWLLNVA